MPVVTASSSIVRSSGSPVRSTANCSSSGRASGCCAGSCTVTVIRTVTLSQLVRHNPQGRSMKLSHFLMYDGNPRAAADAVVTYEKAGLDTVWVAEAYG